MARLAPVPVPKQFVEMKAVTWQKDSHGLFDYETKSLSVKKYQIESSVKIFRNGKKIEIVLDDLRYPMKTDPNQKFLTSVVTAPVDQGLKRSNEFLINPHKSDPENENYLIVRSLKNKEGVQKGYTLEPGDILKLGRIEYAVIEMRDDLGRVNSIKDLFCSDSQLIQKQEIKAGSQITCKICLFEEETADNPFISPCKCKGSCEWVHFECLQQWIVSRGYKKESGNTFIFKWKKLDCEVCQEPLPKRFQLNDRAFDLVQIDRPQTPYVILESISKEKKVSKGVYLIKTPLDEPVKLGRGHQCEIRISDISVSRLHAFIRYESGQFILIDNNSKFGTLVKLSKEFRIKQDKIAIQIGRTVLTFVLKESTQSEIDFGESTETQRVAAKRLTTQKITKPPQQSQTQGHQNFHSQTQNSYNTQPK